MTSPGATPGQYSRFKRIWGVEEPACGLSCTATRILTESPTLKGEFSWVLGTDLIDAMVEERGRCAILAFTRWNQGSSKAHKDRFYETGAIDIAIQLAIQITEHKTRK